MKNKATEVIRNTTTDSPKSFPKKICMINGAKINNMADAIKNVFVGTFDYVKDVIATIGTNLGAFIVNPIVDVLNKIPMFNLKLNKLETKDMPEFKNYINNNNLPVINNNNNQNTQNAGVNHNTQNNTVNVTVASSGDRLQDITKAVEKGFNSNYISPALLLNGAQ